MTKQQSGQPWISDQCFELVLTPDYRDKQYYYSFNETNQPVCTPLGTGFTMECHVKPGTTDTLLFVFKTVSDEQASSSKIEFQLTNFQNPYSSVAVQSIVSHYSDAACSQDLSQVEGTGLNFRAIELTDQEASVTSTSTQVGYAGPENSLVISFAAPVPLPASQQAIIDVTIPDWYNIGDGAKQQYMYNETYRDQCHSDQLSIGSSSFYAGNLHIVVDKFGNYTAGAPITISCPGYRNPIYPDLWTGFRIQVYDSERNKITYTKADKLILDARHFSPVLLDPSNFIITIGDATVATYSPWIFNLDVTTPLDRSCYFKFKMPRDLDRKFESVFVTKIFMNQNKQPTLFVSDLTYLPAAGPLGPDEIVLHGCHDDNSLGEAPSGRLQYSSFAMPRAVMDSESFEIEIYKDEQLTQLIVRMSHGVNIQSKDVKPGSLSNASMTPSDFQVQRVTDLTVAFVTQHALERDSMIRIRMPGGLAFPSLDPVLNITLTRLAGNLLLHGIVTSNPSVPDLNFAGPSSCNGPGCGYYIEIHNVLEQIYAADSEVPAAFPFELLIPDIINQRSARDAGAWQITTFLKFGADYHSVDTVTMPTSFEAKIGGITPAGRTVVVSEPQNFGKNSLYTLEFTTGSDIPANGFVEVAVPPQIIIDVASTKQLGTCSEGHCTDATTVNKIVYLIPEKFIGGFPMTRVIGGLTNPRTFQPTDVFVVTTFDEDGVTQIDQGYNVYANMTIKGEITSVDISPSSVINGQLNTYVFSITVPIPVISGDRIKFEFPPEVGPPRSAELMNCTGVTNVKDVSCAISGSYVVATISNVTFQPDGGTYAFAMSNVANPISTQLSTGFSGFELETADPSFPVANFWSFSAGITNQLPAPLVYYDTEHSSLVPGSITEVYIRFHPVNGLPADGAIQVTYPEQLELTEGDATICRVDTYKTFGSACMIDSEQRKIIVTGVFRSDGSLYANNITVTLEAVRNPATNHESGSYTIKTFADQGQLYIVDELIANKMYLRTECPYPCKSCSDYDRNWCTDCWDGVPSDLQFRMEYGATSTCKTKCDFGYSANFQISAAKDCHRCDDACNGCEDTSVFDCLECNKPSYPFRLANSQKCSPDCRGGYYQWSNDTCERCLAPCLECSGTGRTCTRCDTTSDLPVLYYSECISSCPTGTTDVSGICVQCQPPCATCEGHPERCNSCDGTFGRRLLEDFNCYRVCPVGTTPTNWSSPCIPCTVSGCADCAFNATDYCDKCVAPLLAFEGDCISECPEGFVMTDGKDGCRDGQLADLGVLYFPFLCCAAVAITVVLFGKLRRKDVLVRGKITKISHQSSITCILVWISPLQALATVAQWVLAILYGTIVHAALARAVSGVILVVNLAFLCTFGNKFRGSKLTREARDKIWHGKLTRRQARKERRYQERADPKFHAWYMKHKLFYWTLWVFSLFSSWKFNKLLYSRFFSYGLFTAKWSRAKEYATVLRWYLIVTMIFVDMFLICIDVSGLSSIEGGNQLFITMIETCILSIVSIVLGSIELYRLKDILEYTTDVKDYRQAKVSSGFEEDEVPDSGHTLRGLIAQVKGHKDMFIKDKLDELVDEFGARKCRSMSLLNTAWSKEKDPRKVGTWPTSPSKIAMLDENLKFTAEDMYDKRDNCYFEAIVRHPGTDKALQGNPRGLDFQDAISRKFGELVTAREEPVEEQHAPRSKQHRGRRNKFQAAIEQEDDEAAEYDLASDNDQKQNEFNFLKMREEEDENLRQMVALESAKQATAAEARRKQQEEAAQAQLEAEKAAAEAAAIAEANERVEREVREKVATERLQAEEAKRERLRQEEADEKARRAAEDQARTLELAKQSELARLQYEAEEAEHLKMVADCKAREDAERAAVEKAKAEADLKTKEDVLRTSADQQVKRDAEELRKKQEHQMKFDVERELQRQSAAAENERRRYESQIRDQNERDAQLHAQLEAENEARLAIEAEQWERGRSEREAEESRRKAIEDEAEARRLQSQESPKSNLDDENRNCGAVDSDRRDQAYTEAEVTNKAAEDTAMCETAPPRSGMDSQQREISQEKFLATADINTLEVHDSAIQKFARKADPIIQVPPMSSTRLFNENDILGDLDRDAKGDVVVHTDSKGNYQDKQGQCTNQRGYILDPETGHILENIKHEVMFPSADMDERGEVPAPFCIERFNFNPHDLMGDFDYVDGNPRMMVTNKDFFVDKMGRRVNKHGWMVSAGQGHIVDKHGRKKFDSRQLANDGDLPKLYTLSGKSYKIKDSIGQFGKDSSGSISLLLGPSGQLMDSLGRAVNDRGYLTDDQGNIIDRNGKQLFPRESLLQGEFPKIFSFTKFNAKRVTGDFEMNPSGNPILEKGIDGIFLDKDGRRVTQRGYLTDEQGNVIDCRGNLMFDRCILEADGEIPAVFRKGFLRNDTASQLSQLVSEMEQQEPSEYAPEEETKFARNPAFQTLQHGDGDTSVDSQMEDTPANYNMANQRFEEDEGIAAIPEDAGLEQMASSEGAASRHPASRPSAGTKKSKKKKKTKTATVEFLQPTGRERAQADAYGGAARGTVRRPGYKYAKERLAGSTKFRVSTADELAVRAQLGSLAQSLSGFNPGVAGPLRPTTRPQGLIGSTAGVQPREARSQLSVAQNRASPKRDYGGERPKQTRYAEKPKGVLKDVDFELMFGKDIDAFLEDSELSEESKLNGLGSHASGGAGPGDSQAKLRSMEQQYVQRLDAHPHKKRSALEPPSTGYGRALKSSPLRASEDDSKMRRSPKNKPEPGPHRETIISFTDDPGVIHRGEVLPFHTKKPKDETSSRSPTPQIDAEYLSGNRISPERSSKKK